MQTVSKLFDSSSFHSYYTDSNKHGAPNAYKFSAGLRQQFPKNVCRLQLDKYQVNDLTHYREDYYPIVIAIESIFPSTYKGRSKKSIQFTCGALSIDSDYKFKFKLYLPVGHQFDMTLAVHVLWVWRHRHF